MEIENAKEKLMKDLIEQSNRDEKDLDMKGLEALVKLAINQSKKEGEQDDNKSKTNDER